MFGIHRCAICRRLIWPWDRIGWYTESDGSTVYWHGGWGCR
jgi:hypothetical protein